MPTISEIADYLRTIPADDPIHSKSRERVLTTQAAGIKENEALPGGQCGFCSKHTDRLAPLVMQCCKACVVKIMRYGNGVRVTSPPQFGSVHCDRCLGRALETYQINPFICQACAQQLGRFHKFNTADMKRERQKRKEARK